MGKIKGRPYLGRRCLSNCPLYCLRVLHVQSADEPSPVPYSLRVSRPTLKSGCTAEVVCQFKIPTVYCPVPDTQRSTVEPPPSLDRLLPSRTSTELETAKTTSLPGTGTVSKDTARLRPGLNPLERNLDGEESTETPFCREWGCTVSNPTTQDQTETSRRSHTSRRNFRRQEQTRRELDQRPRERTTGPPPRPRSEVRLGPTGVGEETRQRKNWRLQSSPPTRTPPGPGPTRTSRRRDPRVTPDSPGLSSVDPRS